MPFHDPATAICLCNFCGNPLRFQPLRAGEVINCLHCGMETILYATDDRQPFPKTRSVTVENVRLEITDLGLRYLVGEVINDSAGDLDWIRVQLLLFDINSMPTGVTSDFHLNFRSGRTWTFRAPVFNKDATQASVPDFFCEHGKISHADNFDCEFVAWTGGITGGKQVAANPASQG